MLLSAVSSNCGSDKAILTGEVDLRRDSQLFTVKFEFQLLWSSSLVWFTKFWYDVIDTMSLVGDSKSKSVSVTPIISLN